MVKTPDGRLRYTVFSTSQDWLGILASEIGLLATTLPQPSEDAAFEALGTNTKKATRCDDFFTSLTDRLDGYLNNQKVSFGDEIDPSVATPFQLQVWQVVRGIPYGETRSYYWVAQQIGKPKALRAVGQALARNPLPLIIPCHRVISQSGGLGGFSGGLEVKKYLLDLEATNSSIQPVPPNNLTR